MPALAPASPPSSALPVPQALLVPPVLLVGDEPSLRRLKRLLLEEVGYRVLAEDVLDGRVALDVLCASATPLVVVMNTRIPSLDGASLLRVVLAEPPLQRHAFVLTTALARLLPREMVQLTRALQVPVVGKPFTEQELLTAVARQVQRLQ